MPLDLYTKGPLKLSDLENRIGRGNFIKFLRSAATERVAETNRLISLLGEVISSIVAESFLESLKNSTAPIPPILGTGNLYREPLDLTISSG